MKEYTLSCGFLVIVTRVVAFRIPGIFLLITGGSIRLLIQPMT